MQIAISADKSLTLPTVAVADLDAELDAIVAMLDGAGLIESCANTRFTASGSAVELASDLEGLTLVLASTDRYRVRGPTTVRSSGSGALTLMIRPSCGFITPTGERRHGREARRRIDAALVLSARQGP